MSALCQKQTLRRHSITSSVRASSGGGTGISDNLLTITPRGENRLRTRAMETKFSVTVDCATLRKIVDSFPAALRSNSWPHARIGKATSSSRSSLALSQLFPATSEREKISFHQLNKETGNRIRYKKVDAITGDDVESADIVKGYEVTKGEYIELEPEELDAVAIESKRVI